MKRLALIALTLFCVCSCTQLEPYQNPALSADERADDLLSRLTLEEKISLMIDVSEEIPRLGIRRFQWWNEALHGVARAGLATVLPQPIGMAATFDPRLLETAYSAVSDEARAKHNLFIAEDSHERYQGLTFWTPTVNLLRDPRWGRGIETYGEDPYLTSVMGLAVVRGLQDNDADDPHKKLMACAKHFAVHSGPEWNRHTYNAANIDTRQLYESYLAPFEVLVREGRVGQVICAYNRYEGDPCCGSNTLLNRILRQEWGYEGIVVSDCGAINDFFKEGAHGTHADAAEASAAAVLSGTDLECGSSYKKLMEAVERGLITEADIDVSVRRLLKARFELGEMDEPEGVSWASLPADLIASEAHDSLAVQLARESMTLLTNRNGTLPLKRNTGLTVAVVGANATSEVMQWGNYNGTPRRTITILEGISQALGQSDSLLFVPGCNVVGSTLMNSAFNQCSADGQTGFMAQYWNGGEPIGAPDVAAQVTTPFHFCTSGATVFAPGVALTGFTAKYQSRFTPDRSGEVSLSLYYCGRIALTVDGQEVKSGRTNHGGRNMTHKMHVEAGKSYDIGITFEQYAGDATLDFDLGYEEPVDADRIVRQVAGADVVVFVGGLAPWLEGEEMGVDIPGFYRGDRTEIELPEVQRTVLARLHAAGHRTVFVCCSGSAVAMVPEVANCDAILQAWYPGQSGGRAVAEVLFGDYNPSGRLPLTIYKGLSQLPDFEDYDLNGRTYRYLKQEPLFAFGYGLSYTTYEYGPLQLHTPEVTATDTAAVRIEIPVRNTGEMDGEEIVQVYLKRRGDADGPLKTLRAFQRVAIAAGSHANVAIELTGRQLQWWDSETNTIRITPGEYTLMVGSSSRNEDLQAVDFIIRP